ncbi:CAP domain-containing protein [Conexibacter sp. JD483]|uniref:CAP domain-containing protein n=1 Tax=unclassified Conexibacter TaxID=2627773 RepID=UPI00271CFAFE|nr:MULTISPECIES: CAP domain-containing protein [unclassified Conexibacter]MDO8184848.1 CAP domain-containing protein [Conexibacter sp. CPCC 205706]MDO8196623.1 CAP domain-containing protein [Conexibacter sp. CPCC 205762]MDR9371008.1 CAP domain-containing protein [Conexibacter sp. JD483]
MWNIRAASLAGIAALALAAQPSVAAPAHHRSEKRCSPAGIRAAHGTARAERRIRCLLNARRARTGMRPLRWDRCLDRAAERHARDMVRRRYFAHASLGGRTLVQRARATGYVPRNGRWSLGENLAWGAGRRATAAATVRGWLRSPPHRRNVFTSRFRDVGIAVVHGAPVRLPRGARARVARVTVVAEFGARAPGRCRR